MNRSRSTISRFVVGMSRSGTTWIMSALNEHADVTAFGESSFWGKDFLPAEQGDHLSANQIDAILRRLRCKRLHPREGEPGAVASFSNGQFEERLESQFADLMKGATHKEIFSAIGRAVSEAEGTSVIVEKTPHHVNWIDRIIQAVPEAKFVITVRNPYDFLLSYKHQGDRKEDAIRKEFMRRYHPIAAAFIYRAYLNAALAAVSRHSERVLLVKFEDTRSNPVRVMDQIQEFLSIERQPVGAENAKVNSSFTSNVKPALTTAEVFWVNVLAGSRPAQLGYERRPTPLAFRGDVIWSCLTLPFWAVYNLFDLRKRTNASLFSYLANWVRRFADKTGAGHVG